MNFSKNVGKWDKKVRIVLAVVFGLVAFYWVSGAFAVLFWALAAVMLITAITGFCGLYKLIGVSTFVPEEKCPAVPVRIAFVVFVLALLTVGGYYSNFFTKKFYLEDFNRMNNFYKQTLFFTGQEKRAEAVENYQKLIMAYAPFSAKYQSYHPYALRGDGQLNSDLIRVGQIIASVNDKVNTGDLKAAHTDLEQVRPVFQEIFKRNNFSMLAVTLVDFHDAMEKILTPATEKNIEGTLAVYGEVSEKLKAVEAEANDTEIQSIRLRLDELYLLAQKGEAAKLPEKGNELKSAFVKVYLVRG
ncbi:MAG TPA: DUF2892 domain-containing protein [Candidatus Paceibacterota bacterium]|nr:DUF2892 domain-containing protein [Candidatus Paceibacterota bacterium]